MKAVIEKGGKNQFSFNKSNSKLRPKSQEACFQERKSDIQWLNLDGLRLARGVTPTPL